MVRQFKIKGKGEPSSPLQNVVQQSSTTPKFFCSGPLFQWRCMRCQDERACCSWPTLPQASGQSNTPSPQLDSFLFGVAKRVQQKDMTRSQEANVIFREKQARVEHKSQGSCREPTEISNRWSRQMSIPSFEIVWNAGKATSSPTSDQSLQ